MGFKEELLNQCKGILSQKRSDIQLSVEQAQDSLFNETKSSAGDKYETSREMIQQDLDRLNKQLAAVEKDHGVIDQIVARTTQAGQVVLGSIVQTNQLIYFVAISIGKVICQDREVYVISPQSPIGNVLLGLKEGSRFNFNGQEQLVQSIL